VQILQRHFSDLKVERRPKPAYVPMRGTLDIDKARRLVGFAPSVSLDEGVNRYVAHLRQHVY
jgi:nucleoside-diphosphate-sugar epimerase